MAEADWPPEKVIAWIAKVANAIAWQAGVGGMELAGQFVSALARHPELVPQFLAEGSGCVIEHGLHPEHGCLTFYNMRGEITTPQELHAVREVQKLKRNAGVNERTTAHRRSN